MTEAAILVIVGRTKNSVSAVLAYIRFIIRFDNRTTSFKSCEALGKALGPNLGKNLHFGGLTFERKIKSMESR